MYVKVLILGSLKLLYHDTRVHGKIGPFFGLSGYFYFKKITTTIAEQLPRGGFHSIFYNSRPSMYTRDNGVPIGMFRLFGLDFRTFFDVLAVRSEVHTEG